MTTSLLYERLCFAVRMECAKVDVDECGRLRRFADCKWPRFKARVGAECKNAKCKVALSADYIAGLVHICSLAAAAGRSACLIKLINEIVCRAQGNLQASSGR